MSTRHLLSAALLVAAAAAWGGAASAEISRGVMTAFKGELILTKGELPEGKTEKETIAKIKAERLKELTGDPKGDVMSWHFRYTGFLSKTGSSVLKLEFYTNDKEKKFVADQRLDGVDPKSAVVSGEITIDEDEGLSKGRPYLIKLVNDKDAVVASTPLVMK